MTKSAESKKLLQVIRKLKTGKVLVVGDVMLDQFIYGKVERISPEAPVPVVKVDDDIFCLGGSANVAANLRALGANVQLCGVIGNDIGGEMIINLCDELGIGSEGLVYSRRRKTTIKSRIIAHHQQVVRFDREDLTNFHKKLLDRLIQRVEKFIPEIDAVIISDYGKGVVAKALLDYLRKVKRKTGLLVAVDPKVANFKYYRGMSLMTPNHHEASEMIGRKINNDNPSVEKAAKTLLNKLSMDLIVITRGKEGMTLISKKGGPFHIPTRAKQVFDVTGAGDTVIATLTLALSRGASLYEAAEVANYAAGVVVAKLGTATTDQNELSTAIQRGFP